MLMVFGVVLVSERLLTGLHVAGCVFIAVLAVRTLLGEWRAGRTRNGNAAREGEPASQARGLPGVVRGFLVGIANPKDLLFFVAFFPQFVGITPDSRVSLAILAVDRGRFHDPDQLHGRDQPSADSSQAALDHGVVGGRCS